MSKIAAQIYNQAINEQKETKNLINVGYNFNRTKNSLNDVIKICKKQIELIYLDQKLGIIKTEKALEKIQTNQRLIYSCENTIKNMF